MKSVCVTGDRYFVAMIGLRKKRVVVGEGLDTQAYKLICQGPIFTMPPMPLITSGAFEVGRSGLRKEQAESEHVLGTVLPQHCRTALGVHEELSHVPYVIFDNI